MSTTRTIRSADGEAQAHRAALESVASIVRFLADLLGVSAVAALTKVDPSSVRRWMEEKNTPGTPAEQRLRAAAQVARLLLQHDASHTVRAWFIGLNPQLDDESPIRAIADDHFKDVLSAARAFVDGA